MHHMPRSDEPPTDLQQLYLYSTFNDGFCHTAALKEYINSRFICINLAVMSKTEATVTSKTQLMTT